MDLRTTSWFELPLCGIEIADSLRSRSGYIFHSHMSDQVDRLKSALADRYASERELGSGGTATVYLAEDK